MTTDPPKPDNRDEFIEWMVGRNFKLEQGEDPTYFHAADWYEEVDNVPEGVSPDDLENLETRTVYLRCTVLDTEEIEVEGEHTTAKIDEVLPPEDPSDVHELPFDTVRIEWLQGRLTKL